MIAATILYPKSDDSTFDVDYYANSHMPMFVECLGDACQGWGVISAKDNEYHAIGWAMITSQEAFDAAMSEHGNKFAGDMANYTNVRPTVVVGDVVK